MEKSGQKKRWEQIHHLIVNARRVICSTHINPDGDGLGSQMAFYYYLNGLEKECRILNPSPLPETYHFLSHFAHFESYDIDFHSAWLQKADLAIVFDSGDYKRLKTLGEDLRKYNIPTLSIDHHLHPNPNGFSYALHDVSASATGYLVYEYIKYAKKSVGSKDGLSSEIANGLYLAIMTDTGSFRFNNTSPETHEMAGELLQSGIKPYDLYRQVYESTPVEQVRLMASALKSVKLEGNGRLAWFKVTRDMVKNAGATHEHVNGFTDVARSIRGIEVAVMFHEISEKICRVNFRSKGRIRIDQLARYLGGGGHPFAAGVMVNKSLDQAIKRVIPRLIEEITNQLPEGETG